MNKWLIGAVIGIVAASFTLDAEAQRRLGGGKTFGRQSQTIQQRQAQPPQKAPESPQQAAPAQTPNAAAPAAATAPAAAGAARAASPWRGALMGVAAGLGLMALASWLGFGEQFAMFLMIMLAGLVLAMVLGMILRRRQASPQPAYQGAYGGGAAGGPRPAPVEPRAEPIQRTAAAPVQAGARPGSAMDEFSRPGSAAGLKQPWGVPADFDTAGFLERAKAHFVELQKAWDSGNLDQLADFTTNEMFIELTHELRSRGARTGQTEVLALDAALLGIETGATEHLASVRFHGTLRIDGEIEQVEEVWNLAKPVNGSSGWLLAGIQQLS